MIEPLVSYFRAIFKLAWNRFRFSEPELAHARQDICTTCRYYNSKDTRCGICGCWLSANAEGFGRLFSKVYFPSEECPLRKW